MLCGLDAPLEMCYNKGKEEGMHEGHRKRMLERLEKAEGSLAEHEL